MTGKKASEKREWKAPEVIDIGAIMDVTDGSDGNVRDNHPDVPVFYDNPPFPQFLDQEVDLDD